MLLLLQQCIIAADGQNLTRRRMPGSNCKGKTPALLYLAVIGLSLVQVHLAPLSCAIVAMIWLPPRTGASNVISSGHRRQAGC